MAPKADSSVWYDKLYNTSHGTTRASNCPSSNVLNGGAARPTNHGVVGEVHYPSLVVMMHAVCTVIWLDDARSFLARHDVRATNSRERWSEAESTLHTDWVGKMIWLRRTILRSADLRKSSSQISVFLRTNRGKKRNTRMVKSSRTCGALTTPVSTRRQGLF